jgi:hypothetical protein
VRFRGASVSLAILEFPSRQKPSRDPGATKTRTEYVLVPLAYSFAGVPLRIWSGFCVTRVNPAGTSNRLESSEASENELTSMVISISEPGVEGGGGFWLFWSAASSCFFFFPPNNPPRPFAMAALMLVGVLSEFDEEDEEFEEEAEEAAPFEFCAAFPDASC